MALTYQEIVAGERPEMLTIQRLLAGRDSALEDMIGKVNSFL